MIIQNGTIEPKIKTGGGIDLETGYSKAVSFSWGTPIPCQYSAAKYNQLACLIGEHITTASYTILIDQQPLAGIEQVRLKDLSGNEVGEFSIKQIEPLDAVCQTRITV